MLLKRQFACMHKRRGKTLSSKTQRQCIVFKRLSPSSAQPHSRHLDILLSERRIILSIAPLPHILVSPVVPPRQCRAPRPPRDGRCRRAAPAGDDSGARRLSAGASAPRSYRIGRPQSVAPRVGPLVPLPTIGSVLHARQRWRCRSPRAEGCASGGAVGVRGRDVLDGDLLSSRRERVTASDGGRKEDVTAGSGRRLRVVDGDGGSGGMWRSSTSRAGLSATRVVWWDLESRVGGRQLRRRGAQRSSVARGSSRRRCSDGGGSVARIASFDLLWCHLGEHGAKSLAQLVHALARVDAEGRPLVRIEVL